jgi:glycosyltransferase involved in cell wall biosynthesis
MEIRQKLRVIHLATSHEGGAGISARRLNAQLNNSGVRSYFYALNREGYLPTDNEYRIPRNLFMRALSYGSTKIAKITSGITFFSIYSSPGVSMKWLKQICAGEQIVLHIHNWFNLISMKQLRKICEKGIPVVMTMHDQRLMTGGCHTTLGCNEFHSGCKRCPKINSIFHPKVRKNVQAMEELCSVSRNNLRIIAPSKFMVVESAKSQSLKLQNVEFIPNKFSMDLLIDPAVRANSTVMEGFKIGVASADPQLELKGGDLILELSNCIIDDNLDLSLIYLKDFPESDQVEFWTQIDCLLVPSRGDNSPNVIHEAKFFNIPVISTNVGGIPELLSPNFDIMLDADSISMQAILQAIYQIKSKNFATETVLQMRSNYESYTVNSISDLVKIYESFVGSI